jgi:predicted TIM-barrel fold metal-dependent hydrolase
MTLKPIDAHCHLFSAKYVVEEAAAMGWAYVTGNYPHAEVATKALRAVESPFSWSRLEDIVKWFLDLGAAVSSYETNYQNLAEACRRGLNLPSEEELVVAPLMMDIFYMFGPPAGRPAQEVKAGRPVRTRKVSLGDIDREASEAAFKRFQTRVTDLAAERSAAPKAKGLPAGGRVSIKTERTAPVSAAEIDRIFLAARSKGTSKAVMKDPAAGREISRGFKNQIDALIGFQACHPGSVFPFFAVDPRRRGVIDMAIRGIPELNGGKPLVTPRGPFFGVKLYTRLGYLPENVPDEFYGHCATNQLPITVHTSAKGFPPGADWEYAGYAAPRHWQAILDKHPFLRLDFAHFGNGNPEWTRQILDLMTRYPNVYADLACYTDAGERSEVRRMWSQGGIIRDRLLFGTDFVVSSLTKALSLEGYFSAFRELFDSADMETLITVNTRKFLEPILPAAMRTKPRRRVSAAASLAKRRRLSDG